MYFSSFPILICIQGSAKALCCWLIADPTAGHMRCAFVTAYGRLKVGTLGSNAEAWYLATTAACPMTTWFVVLQVMHPLVIRSTVVLCMPGLVIAEFRTIAFSRWRPPGAACFALLCYQSLSMAINPCTMLVLNTAPMVCHIISSRISSCRRLTLCHL